jgi:hypothetical protein
MSINVNLESSKNSKFNLKIENSNSKLYVCATNLTTNPIKNYNRELTLEQIQENKYFSFCDNISEVVNELTEIKNTKIEEENDHITLLIPINSKKFKDFIIKIGETPESNEKTNEELYSIINELKIENINLKSKVEALEEKFNKEIKIIEIKKEKEINIIKQKYKNKLIKNRKKNYSISFNNNKINNNKDYNKFRNSNYKIRSCSTEASNEK